MRNLPAVCPQLVSSDIVINIGAEIGITQIFDRIVTINVISNYMTSVV